MKDLKITQVQVDCRELSQEQIDKVISVFVKHEIPKCSTIASGIEDDYTYLRVYNNIRTEITFLRFNEDFTTLTYDQFIKLINKPKFEPKQAIKELEQRIALLEQKLSEKEQSIDIEKGMQFFNNVNNAYYDILSVEDGFVRVKRQKRDGVNKYNLIDVVKLVNAGLWELQNTPTEKKESELLKQAKERYKQDDVVNCLAFKNYGTLDFSKEGYVSESQIWVYSPTLDTNICVYKDGVWAGLKKEEVLTKGAICKFWNDDEDNYEIGRYEETNDFGYINIFTLEASRYAKVISVDEALELFKKQLLNEN